MANSIYFKNCLRAIRHTVYGRDNRKPIADAIEQIRTFNDGAVRKNFPILDDMDAKLGRSIASIFVDPMETWYTYDYRDIKIQEVSRYSEDRIATVVTDQMIADVISDLDFNSCDFSWNDADFTWNCPVDDPSIADYSIVDGVGDDSVSLISGDDESYLWIIPNPAINSYIHDGDDYVLTITRINGS